MPRYPAADDSAKDTHPKPSGAHADSHAQARAQPQAAQSRSPSSNSATSWSSFDGYRDSTLSVFALLLAFRIANALTLSTFFQPDEFFQSLEPAWQLAFGPESQAWITWEWRTQLRSSLHPELFAVVYLVAAKLSQLCGLDLPSQAELYIAAPRVTQAVFAALLDLYTWKLAERTYGVRSRTAFVTLALSLCSPWQWFCSTRTLSNSLETTLTSIAIYHWPWHWLVPQAADTDRSKLGSLKGLRISLLLAACACILRPTNVLIWIPVSIPTFWELPTGRQRYVLVREILQCGSLILVLTTLSDYLFYSQTLTFPPYNFLTFNITQSLAVFYGVNRTNYYITEGLPLLLTTTLPFTIPALYHSIRSRHPTTLSPLDTTLETLPTKRVLSYACLLTTAVLSSISHKEVRFIYPLLPLLLTISAAHVTSFFFPPAIHSLPHSIPKSLSRKIILASLLSINLALSAYLGSYHQRGVIDVLTYLRTSHTPELKEDVGFLMPCHSTPWRSHLVYPELNAWALSCEPPLSIPFEDRAGYLDEADQFYISPGPVGWLEENMQDVSSIRRTPRSGGSRTAGHWKKVAEDVVDLGKKNEGDGDGKRKWPNKLIFFAALEDTLVDYVGQETRYVECWRGFNTHFHDDGRRVGDVVVWCLE